VRAYRKAAAADALSLRAYGRALLSGRRHVETTPEERGCLPGDVYLPCTGAHEHLLTCASLPSSSPLRGLVSVGLDGLEPSTSSLSEMWNVGL
jgi:hypothetical protein